MGGGRKGAMKGGRERGKGGKGGKGGRGGGGAPAAVPWTMGLSIVPRGPTQTRHGSSPSYLRKSKTDLAAHLRMLLPAGRPGPSARVRQRHSPICLRVPVTNHPKALDPPELASQSHPRREGVGLPGASPPTYAGFWAKRTRPSTPMHTTGGLSTAGVASTVTLHHHAHCRWPGYPRVL